MLPSFTNTLTNVSVPIERDVTFTCNVKNIGHYRVGGAHLAPIIRWALRHYTDCPLLRWAGWRRTPRRYRQSATRSSPTTRASPLAATLRPPSTFTSGQCFYPRCVLTSDNVQVGEPGWRGPVHVSDQHWPHDLSVRLAQCPDPPRYRHGPDLGGHHRPGAWGEPGVVSAEWWWSRWWCQDTVRLTCHAEGVPTPRIVWRREGGGKIRVRSSHHQHRWHQESGYICNSETIRADKWTSGLGTRSRYIGWGARTWGPTSASPAMMCRPPSASGYTCTCNVGKITYSVQRRRENEFLFSFPKHTARAVSAG